MGRTGTGMNDLDERKIARAGRNKDAPWIAQQEVLLIALSPDSERFPTLSFDRRNALSEMQRKNQDHDAMQCE